MFVRGPNPIWSEFNLTGAIFDDTYYAFFLTNTLPYLPQAVFQDPNGVNPWSDPIEFQPSGGLPNNLYFDPDLVYRIEFRQGPTQADPLIYLIENYIASGGGTPSPSSSDALLTASNMITNPQFADIAFTSPFTFTQGVGGTYTIPVGPGWNLILNGTGTTVLTQGTNDGNSQIEGNPAYYLQINNNGWTSAVLVQTFSNNGAIFGGGAIACAFSAVATSTTQQITVSYVPSVGAGTTIINNANVLTGNFQNFAGAVNLPESTNTDTGQAAFVNIQFALPSTGIVSISNIQITGQSVNLLNPNLTPPLYQEETYERMVDEEFHYYKNSIIFLPKASILTGWNFGLNPWQFTSTTPANVAVNGYTADQTIIIQQNYVANGTGNNIAVGKANLINQKGGLNVTAVTAHNQFAILQYVDFRTMEPYWSDFVSAFSSLVSVYLSTTGSTTITFKMRLISTATAPSTTSQNYPIASWVEGSDPVFAAGVTAIIPQNDPVFTWDPLVGGFNKFPFDNFSLPVSSSGGSTLGVLVYTTSNMNQAIGDFIVFGDVSLVPNTFAINSNTKTVNEVLFDCQYYYCKTLPQGTPPVQSSPAGLPGSLAYQAFEAEANSGGYYWAFPSVMRIQSPTMSYFSPVLPTNNHWYNETQGAASGTASTDFISDRGVFVGNPQVMADAVGDLMILHATADARLGV